MSAADVPRSGLQACLEACVRVPEVAASYAGGREESWSAATSPLGGAMVEGRRDGLRNLELDQRPVEDGDQWFCFLHCFK